MFTPLSLFLPILVFMRGTVADTNYFDNLPTIGPTNPLYTVGEIVQLSWSMNFTGAELTLCQDKTGNKKGGASVIVLQNTNLQALRWHVSYEGLDPGISRIFYFTVGNGGEYDFDSRYFYIFDGDEQQETSPTSTDSAVAESAESTVSSSSTGNDSGLSGGAISGISIAATLGVVAIVGVAVGFFIRRRLRNRRVTPALEKSNGGNDSAYPRDNVAAAVMSQPQPQELSGNVKVAELHGN